MHTFYFMWTKSIYFTHFPFFLSSVTVFSICETKPKPKPKSKIFLSPCSVTPSYLPYLTAGNSIPFFSISFTRSLFHLSIVQMYIVFYWNCRESLFATGISSSTKLPSSNTQAPGAYKFTTFRGNYNPLDADVVGAQEIAMQSTYNRRDASITPNRLEGTSPGVVYTYEPPTKYETPSPATSSSTGTNLRTFGGGSKKNSVKMEQSQLMLEIRNSAPAGAPDVIIMTSHWFRIANTHR